MFYLASNPKKVILSEEKETKMNKTFDIFTFSLTLCVAGWSAAGRGGVEVEEGADIYIPYKNKAKFFHLDIELEVL